MDYQQQYIQHEYIELKMPAGRDSNGKATFLLDPNHLHVWPRHSFMLIALPNKVLPSPYRLKVSFRFGQDKTFTCTLFAPCSALDQLRSTETILDWFGAHFSDALPLIGEKVIVNALMENPRSPLISTKVNLNVIKESE